MKYLGTGALGFGLGVAAMWVGFAVRAGSAPATPTLRPAAAIRVTLYPCSQLGVVGGRVIDVPPDEVERFARLITPGPYYAGGLNELIMPLVAEVVVTHPDATTTTALVRWSGVNPALVSLDGEHYYHAVNDPDVRDGACRLLARVGEWDAGKR